MRSKMNASVQDNGPCTTGYYLHLWLPGNLPHQCNCSTPPQFHHSVREKYSALHDLVTTCTMHLELSCTLPLHSICSMLATLLLRRHSTPYANLLPVTHFFKNLINTKPNIHFLHKMLLLYHYKQNHIHK